LIKAFSSTTQAEKKSFDLFPKRLYVFANIYLDNTMGHDNPFVGNDDYSFKVEIACEH
jgi:hypothetical protein